MRKIAIPLLIVGLFMLIPAVNAQSGPPRTESNPQVEAEIKALDRKLADLIVHANWDEYEQHLGGDYLHTGYNGQVETKDEALALLRDERRKIIVMEPETTGERIRVYGDTAVFNGEYTVSVRESGQLKSHRIRQTDVFVRREGKWYLVVGQSTPIGK